MVQVQWTKKNPAFNSKVLATLKLPTKVKIFDLSGFGEAGYNPDEITWSTMMNDKSHKSE